MTRPPPTPTAYTIAAQTKLLPIPSQEIDSDPRGIVWMYEEPNPRATYVVGVDPTVGITNWDRNLRTEDDSKTDNGAIEVIRVGRNGSPDVQVCEYAAPIDPEDLAVVVNALGRLYCGNTEDQQALCIVEVYPGPGLLTQRRMINEFGYTSLFVWKYLDSMTTKPTNSLGWTASPKSVRDLWIRGSRHINRGRIIIRSEAFVEEMTDCEQDALKMTAKASYGAHDDRVRALLMAIWAAHDWNSQIETDSHSRVEVGSQPVNWQQSDISSERLMEAWEARFSEISEDPY